jgi:hypothetical protein
MATTVTVNVKTTDEHVVYQVGMPPDINFYTKDGVTYAQFWNRYTMCLVTIPARQLISIE